MCNCRRRFECLFRQTQDQPRRNSKLHWKMWLVSYACVRFGYGLVLLGSLCAGHLQRQVGSSKICSSCPERSNCFTRAIRCEDRILGLGSFDRGKRKRKTQSFTARGRRSLLPVTLLPSLTLVGAAQAAGSCFFGRQTLIAFAHPLCVLISSVPCRTGVILEQGEPKKSFISMCKDSVH